jgi:hypothetical protein
MSSALSGSQSISPGSIGLGTAPGSNLGARWAETNNEMALGRLQGIADRWGMAIPANVRTEYLRLEAKGGMGQQKIEQALMRIGLLKDQAAWAAQTSGASPSNITVVSSAPTEFGAFNDAGGGVVPGPIGSPQRGTAHGGEVIGAPEQIVAALAAALERTGGGAGGDLVVHVSLDGRSVVQSIRIPLQEAIRVGQVQVRAS